MALAATARWTAIAIAAAAVLDPAVPLPTRARPAIRVVGGPVDLTATVTRQLRDAGFAADGAQDEVATVLVGDAPWYSAPGPSHFALGPSHLALGTSHLALGTSHFALGTSHFALGTSHLLPVWALDTSPRAPNVRIIDATGPAVRLPEQALDVWVTVEARGLAGKSTEIVLEDGGIVVASASHGWKTDSERWQAALRYLPPGAAGGRLRVRAIERAEETSGGDNAAEIAVPPMRGPIRVLVAETGVTWPAMFVRRAVEGEPAFAVAALQRASTRLVTRAGAPPAGLTRETLAPFEAALVGAPDNLTPTEIAALRWFVEQRGGVAVLIPDAGSRGPGGYRDLLDALVLEPRVLEAPAVLHAFPGKVEGPRTETVEKGMKASELLVTRRTPAGSRTLAATDAGEAVVFSARRGAGAVIFSGALDAWRYRAQDEEAFARFWRRAIAEDATAVPPLLELSVEPALVAAGTPARVRARLCATELPTGAVPLDIGPVTARAVSPGARVDVPIRLWPTAEPGVYEGEWRPSAIGDYNIAVTAGARRGDAAATVAATVARGSTADPEGLALVARSSGGGVFPADRLAALVEAMKAAFPPRASSRSSRPMRSPWWVVPFAGLLCAEWALRRRRGLP
jgi:hypothetical protein